MLSWSIQEITHHRNFISIMDIAKSQRLSSMWEDICGSFHPHTLAPRQSHLPLVRHTMVELVLISLVCQNTEELNILSKTSPDFIACSFSKNIYNTLSMAAALGLQRHLCLILSPTFCLTLYHLMRTKILIGLTLRTIPRIFFFRKK